MPRQLSELVDQRKLILPITKPTLDQTFADAGVPGMPNRDLTDFVNGVAIDLQHIDPPQTAAQLTERIKSAEQEALDPSAGEYPGARVQDFAAGGSRGDPATSTPHGPRKRPRIPLR